MNIEELIAQKQALGEQWIAAGRPESGPIRDALSKCIREIAAAKRAAEEQKRPSAAETSAAIDKLIERQRRNEAAAALRARVRRAARMYEAANEWPRCLEGWPATPAEEEADRLLREHPELA